MMQQVYPTPYSTTTPDQVQLIFLYNGAFRTWGQVKQRAKLNTDITSYLNSHPLQRVMGQVSTPLPR